MGRSGTDSAFTSAKYLLKCCLLVLIRALLECDRAIWSYPWPMGTPRQCDSAGLALKPPPPRFCCRYHKIFHFLMMVHMLASPPSLPPINVVTVWRNRHIPTKKWQWPCGKVPPIVQARESKAFGIHCSVTQYTDWVRYGKVVMEFFQGSVSKVTSLLSMLIRVDKHPQRLGAVRLASTLAAAGAAAVVELGPTLQVPDLDIDTAMEMDVDAPSPVRERKCPGFSLGRPSPRGMYPIMRGNYEKPPWESCNRQGLFAVDGRSDGRWVYGPCLPCPDLLSGKHPARLNSWMNTAIDPKDTEPLYRQGPKCLSCRLNEPNDRGYVA